MNIIKFENNDGGSLKIFIKDNGGTDFISNDNVREIYLLKDKNNILGYIAYNVISPEAEVLYLLIDKNNRNKGLGYKLLNESLDIMKNEGVSKCFLEVDIENYNAYHLYKKLGFIEISKRMKYYDNGNDSIVMEKEI